MNSALSEAQQLLERREYEAALELFRSMSLRNPQDGEAHQGLAQCYYALGQAAAASSAARIAIEADSTLALPHLVLAYIHHDRGDLESALTEAASAYALKPQITDIANCYGGLLLGSGRADEAVRVLTQLLQLHPESQLAMQNLAASYREQGNKSGYLEQVRRIFAAHPTLGNALSLLGAIQYLFAAPASVAVILSILAAWALHAKLLLLVPALMVAPNIYADARYLIDGHWMTRRGRTKVVLSATTDIVVVGIIFAIWLST